MHENASCYVIGTPTMTFYYEKNAGGFSRLLDNDSVDWIQFINSGNPRYPFSAGADYRGIPNLVHTTDDQGVGHPGFEKVNSRFIDDHTLYSESLSKQWAWTWTFFEDYAELNIRKVNEEGEYWFLYEGTIAGTYAPQNHYWGTDLEGPRYDTPDRNNGEILFGHWQIAYFGQRNYPRILYFIQEEKDTLIDTFSYLGNSEKGLEAEDGMVVFGFGRKDGATPIFQEPNSFIMGFYEKEIKTQEDHQILMKNLRSRFGL